MPSRNKGMRWIWKKHKCECGDCKKCRSRIRMRNWKRNKIAAGGDTKSLHAVSSINLSKTIPPFKVTTIRDWPSSLDEAAALDMAGMKWRRYVKK